MARLTIKYDFTLETDEKDYHGSFVDLSKKQIKELKKTTSKATANSKEIQKLFKKLDNVKEMLRLADKADMYEDAIKYQKEKVSIETKMQPLIESINDGDTDDIYKARLDISIVSDNKAEILALGEEYGYQLIFDTIQEDVEDKKAKN